MLQTGESSWKCIDKKPDDLSLKGWMFFQGKKGGRAFCTCRGRRQESTWQVALRLGFIGRHSCKWRELPERRMTQGDQEVKRNLKEADSTKTKLKNIHVHGHRNIFPYKKMWSSFLSLNKSVFQSSKNLFIVYHLWLPT